MHYAKKTCNKYDTKYDPKIYRPMFAKRLMNPTCFANILSDFVKFCANQTNSLGGVGFSKNVNILLNIVFQFPFTDILCSLYSTELFQTLYFSSKAFYSTFEKITIYYPSIINQFLKKGKQMLPFDVQMSCPQCSVSRASCKHTIWNGCHLL